MEAIKKKLAKVVILVVYVSLIISLYLVLKDPDLSVKLMLALLEIF